MFFTTNLPPSDPETERLVARLHEIRDGSRSTAVVAEFSDLDRRAAVRLAPVWRELPVDARRFAVRAMIDLAESDVELNFARILRLAAADPDAEVRALAIGGLWEDESTLVLDDLLARLATEDEAAVREAMVVALGRFNYRASVEELDEPHAAAIRAALLDVVHSNESVGVRRRALESLAYLSNDPEVDDAIAGAFESPYRDLRVSALFAMGRNLNRRWFDTVLEELESDDAEFRYEAAKASGEYGDSRAVDPLLELIDDEDREVQLAAVGALGQIGGRMALSALRRLARSEDEVLRDAAADALEQSTYDANPFGSPR
ncbi:MAG TPA: HEAT repeat domain-containing protein [Thermomicrobiaceae bacterium]|nr:HEAT repeat domain-containing protein [Thermomicrobiaceae bacterium]